MSMQNIIYKMLKIPVSKLRIYFSKLSHDSLENVLIYVLGRLKWSDGFTVELINKYSQTLDRFRNHTKLFEDAKTNEYRPKDLAKNSKIIQISLKYAVDVSTKKQAEIDKFEAWMNDPAWLDRKIPQPLAKFEELDTKEKAVDAEIQAHKEKLKAKGDPFADLL